MTSHVRRAGDMRLAGLEPLNIGDDSLFVNVGERTNVTGSRVFAKLILSGDFAGAVEIARQQVAAGAQIIDVNMDEAMLDSKAAMTRFLSLVAGENQLGERPRAGDVGALADVDEQRVVADVQRLESGEAQQARHASRL